MFPLNIAEVLKFVLLEAVLEKCYTVLRVVPPLNSVGLELLKNRSKDRPLFLELRKAKSNSVGGFHAAISALYRLT